MFAGAADGRDSGAVAEITALLDAATGRILGGDGGGWKGLVSGQDDVTLLGAYGGHTTGRDAVATRFDYVAATYAGAEGTTWRENIASWVGDDWACFVDIEHHRAKLDGSAEPVDFAYAPRTCSGAKRASGRWCCGTPSPTPWPPSSAE